MAKPDDNGLSETSLMWLSGLGGTYNAQVRQYVVKNRYPKRSPETKPKRSRRKIVRSAKYEDGKSKAIQPSPRVSTPSHSLVFYDCFLQDFLRYGQIPTQTQNSFMEELGLFESRNPDLTLLRLAVRASTCMFHGNLNRNPQVRAEGLQLGFKAVHALQRQLSLIDIANKNMGAGQDKLPSFDLISAALMLAFYECTSGTSPTGWLSHLHGAESLVHALGPERYQTGFAFSILRCLRYAAVSRSSEIVKTLQR